jgi:GH25 family lysozyme M1 (1,4-beta-N-acetylmuramidase)
MNGIQRKILKVICFTFFLGTAFLLSSNINCDVYAASKTVKITKIYNAKTGNKIIWSSTKKYTGYAIYRSVNDGKYQMVDYVKSKKYTDTNIETGSSYKYKIRPYNTKKQKKKYYAYSIASKSLESIPYAVTSASVISMTDYNLLTWQSNSLASGYYLYRKSNDTDWELICTSSNAYGLYDDYDIVKGKKYSYKIVVFEIIDGVSYESLPVVLTKEEQIKGIDVSYHNGTIDWSKVKQSGVIFAMIRLGYGTTKGGIVDTKLDYNYKQAKKNGIKIGFYLYSYADNVKEAKKEAIFTEKLLKEYSDFDYPIAFDFENSYRNKEKYKKANTKIITTYCDYLESKGYDTCVYSYLSFFKKAVNCDTVSKYGIWLARWTFDPKTYNSGGIPNVEMWQYSDNGRISGIGGAVDLNINIIKR